jgi:UDP-GlcNAc:undecaprenyl-phosphate GlcNAc-1-phosphate transferase
MFLIGLLDDLRGLRPWQKLSGQVLAAAVAFAAGVHIGSIAGHPLPHWIALPATLLWLIGCSNALNLIDGVDGLAAGVALFATVTTLIAALLQHNVPLALATGPLVGATLGFLRYNFNPASIFLGDSGSRLLGFLLGCYGILWSEKSATILGMTAPLLALAIPLLDTALAIVRRFLRHQPIFGADRGHIHHKLLSRGFTPRRVVLLIYAVCAASASLSLLLSFAHDQFRGFIIVFFCIGAWIGIQHLGYAEFDIASRLLMGGTFRRLLNAQLLLRGFQDRLNAASTPVECWNVLNEAYPNFGFFAAEFKLDGHAFDSTANVHHVPEAWNLTIPLSPSDYIRLSRESTDPPPAVVAAFADSLNRTLRAKFPDLIRPAAARAKAHTA